MPSAVFAKLNLKDHKDIVIVNAPDSFRGEMNKLSGVKIRTSFGRAPAPFSLSFVTKQSEVDALGRQLAQIAEGDAIVWLAYPKGSSKRYTSEINRDHGWKVLGEAGFEPVRMVAIDEDWSAVRFRRVEHIKTMTRDVRARLTKAGRARS